MQLKQSNQIRIKDAIKLSEKVFESSFLTASVTKEDDFSHKNIRLLYIGKKLVSMACILPRIMYIDGIKVKAAGIAGVATAPDERGKGYAAVITRDAVEFIKKEGYPLTYLNPYKASYYEQFGYSPVSFRFKVLDSHHKLNIQRGYSVRKFEAADKNNIKTMAEIHKKYCADKTGPVERTIKTWLIGTEYIKKEGKYEGIGISPAFMAFKGNKACAYALIGPTNEKENSGLKISELCFLPGHKDAAEALAERALKYAASKGESKIYCDYADETDFKGLREPDKKEKEIYSSAKHFRMYRSGNFEELKKVIVPLVLKRFRQKGIKGDFDIKRTEKNMHGEITLYISGKIRARVTEGVFMKMVFGTPYKTKDNTTIIKAAFPALKPVYMDFDFL